MKDVKASTDPWTDPCAVVLNLAASQRWFKAGGGSGWVSWDEVFPKAERPSPPDYRKHGGMPKDASRDRSDDMYEATVGKYAARPRWDWTALSATECLEWALKEAFTDEPFRSVVRQLVFTVHPDCGRFYPEDYPGNPFLSYAQKVLPGGRSRDFEKVLRSSYSTLKRFLWMAIGEETVQDELARVKARSDYEAARRHLNAMDAKEAG